jgi:hypothetical protein
MNHDVLEIALQRLRAEIDKADEARAFLQGDSSAADCLARMQASILREPSLREHIDQFCREWAHDRPRTVILDPAATVFAWDRFVYAHGLVFWLHQSGFRGPDISIEAFLELLLVDYWKQAGVFGWQGTLVDMQRMSQK